MKKSKEQFVDEIKKYLSTLRDHERIEFISDIMEDYCEFCGSEDLPCYCMVDD